MAKYKLKALSVQIKEHLYKKEQGYIFDTDGKDEVSKVQIELAYKANYLDLIPEPIIPSQSIEESIPESIVPSQSIVDKPKKTKNKNK